MSRAKGSTRSRRTPRGKKAAGPPVLSQAVVLRGLLGIAWLAALAAVGYGLYALDRPDGLARQAYADVSEYPTRLEWVQIPPWLDHERYRPVLAEIENKVGLSPGASVRDPEFDICKWVHQRVLASPWVSRVNRVSKRADNVLRVDAEFRKPLTYVLSGHRAYLVDEAGVRLPRVLLPGEVHADWLRVEGVRAAPPEVGLPWPGGDVAAGLALVKTLAPADPRSQWPSGIALCTIDVSRYDGSPAGVLRLTTTDPGVTITWGRPAGAEYDTEVTAPRKIERLRELLSRNQGRPAAAEYDLRPEDEIWARGTAP